MLEPLWSDFAGAGATADERRSGYFGTEFSSENPQGKKSIKLDPSNHLISV